MSLYDYQVSQDIDRHDLPFYALSMAAMRKADTNNWEKLRDAWPEVWHELDARYHAPGGALTAAELQQVMQQNEADA